MQCQCRGAPAAVLVSLLLAVALCQAAAEYSQLWGRNGERWRRNSRIVDQSYAGYGAGARALPSYGLTFNVKNYGAKGDNRTDDSDAFLRAIRAASLAAFNITSVPCRGPRTPRPADSLFLTAASKGRCPIPHLGFGNLGKAGATVYIPPGTYRITKMLELTQSNVVVRGAGQGKTVLHFPRGLKSIYGNQMEWQWSGGFLAVVGPEINSTHTGYRLANITANVVKGQRRLGVSKTTGIAVGQWAGPGGFLPLSPAMEEAWRQAQALGLGRPEHTEPVAGQVGIASADGTLDAYIFGENLVPSGSEPFPLERIRFVSRVASKGPRWIELERPLPYDLRLEWEPAVYSFEQAVQHSGWEGFTVEFAWTPYPSHFVVAGMNGFWFSGAANCWVRNVDIVNADTGGEAINSDFMTMSNIKLWHTAPRTGKGMQKGANGHHGLWAAHSSNVLISQATFNTMFIHDLTLDVWAQECVFKNSRGLDLNTDMHRGGAHNNLWANLHLGKGLRAFASSGSSIRGAHAAANNTWWNIQSERGVVNIPECGYGAYLNFVGPNWGSPDNKAAGVNSQLGGAPATGAAGIKSYCPQNRWYTEVVRVLVPADLHVAMRATRLARLGVP